MRVLLMVLLLAWAAPAAAQPAQLQTGTVDLLPGRDFLWMVTHEVSGHRAYTGMYEREGRRQIATTAGLHG